MYKTINHKWKDFEEKLNALMEAFTMILQICKDQRHNRIIALPYARAYNTHCIPQKVLEGFEKNDAKGQ